MKQKLKVSLMALVVWAFCPGLLSAARVAARARAVAGHAKISGGLPSSLGPAAALWPFLVTTTGKPVLKNAKYSQGL